MKWSHPKFNNLLASAGYDCKVHVWEEQDKVYSTVFSYLEHEAAVNSLDFADYRFGLVLLACSSDGTFSIHRRKLNNSGYRWDSFRYKNAHTFGCLAVDFAPFIAPFAPITEEAKIRFATGGCDSLIKLWRLNGDVFEEENFESETLKEHSGWVRDLSWKNKLVQSKEVIASCGEDGRIILWTNAGKGWQKVILGNFEVPVWTVAFNSNVNLLSAATGENVVQIYKEGGDKTWQRDKQLPIESNETSY